MLISPDAGKFLERHLKEYDRPVLLIYDTKQPGWWGIERETRVKLAEYPFHSADNLHDKKIQYVKLNGVTYAPCEIYVEHDLVDLLRRGIVELEKIGMFRHLNLTYWMIHKWSDFTNLGNLGCFSPKKESLAHSHFFHSSLSRTFEIVSKKRQYLAQ